MKKSPKQRKTRPSPLILLGDVRDEIGEVGHEVAADEARCQLTALVLQESIPGENVVEQIGEPAGIGRFEHRGHLS